MFTQGYLFIIFQCELFFSWKEKQEVSNIIKKKVGWNYGQFVVGGERLNARSVANREMESWKHKEI